MKFFRQIFSVCFLACFPLQSWADLRPEAELIRLAQQHLPAPATFMTRGSNGIKRAFENETASIYASDGVGFVVLSKYDEFPELLAYSSSFFDAESIPCGLEWWLNSVNVSMQERLKSDDTTIISTAKSVVSTPVEPIISTKWNQGTPFNALTPLDASGKNTRVGCVATAMAQLLNYHKYPSSAKFMGQYSLVGSNSTIKVPVNSTYTYDLPVAFGSYYLNGSLKLPKPSPTADQKQAVAQLSYDCGVSVSMMYGLTESGSYAHDVPVALIDCFSYPRNSVKFLAHDYATDVEWYGTIYQELAKGFPVFFSAATKKNEGHAFIIDGMDADGFVHINWGWSGEGDGYYNLDILDSPLATYTEQQVAVVGIRPTALPEDHITSSFVSSEPYTITSSEDGSILYLDISKGIYNSEKRPFQGSIFLMLEDMDNNILLADTAYITPEDEKVEMYFGIHTNNEVPFTLDGLPTGNTYRMYMATQSLEEQADDHYSPIRVLHYGTIFYEVTVDTEGKYTVSEIKTGLHESSADTYISTIYAPESKSERLFDLWGHPVADQQKGWIIRNGKTYYIK